MYRRLLFVFCVAVSLAAGLFATLRGADESASLSAIDTDAREANQDIAFGSEPEPLRSREGVPFDCGPLQLTMAYNASVDIRQPGRSTPEQALERFQSERPIPMYQGADTSYFVGPDGSRAARGDTKIFDFFNPGQNTLRLQARAEAFGDQWYLTGLLGCRDAIASGANSSMAGDTQR